MMRRLPLAFPALFLLLGTAVAAPAPDAAPDAALTTIAFGSCADQGKPLPIYDTIAALKPDLLLLLGDNIYADLDKSRKVTPEVIREKYDLLAGLPGWKKLKATCPMLATWDDHDFGKNDGGAEFDIKDESQKLFHDFLGTPAESPRRSQKGVYHSAVYGPEGMRVQVILLDTRYFRTGLKTGGPATISPYGVIRKPYVPSDDPGAMFLGEDQWKWLEDQLRQPADVRLLCSSIQVLSEDHPFEKWANIPAERNRLYKVIRDTQASGVVILSGDRHLGELSLATGVVGYPLYDLTSSGFNQGADAWRAQEPNRLRVSSMPYGDHFGIVRLDWKDKTISLQLRDVSGEITLKQTFPMALLRAQDKKPEDKKPDDKKPDEKLPDGVLTPAEAAKKVGEVVKVQFTVKAGRAVNDGKRLLLNSDKDFRSKDNFTVVLNAKAMTGKWEKATYDTFKDKVIRADGKVVLYKDSPQIQLDDEAKLEIVEKK